MAQRVLITLTTTGTDTGPLFDLYSIDQYDVVTGPFQQNINKISLVTGYTSTIVPDSCEKIRVQSKGNCENYVDISLPKSESTPTPTPTSTPTPTPTPTATPTITPTPTQTPEPLMLCYSETVLVDPCDCAGGSGGV